MSELNAAWRKRIEALMDNGGWALHTPHQENRTVGCWLYSVSLDNGPRLITQIATELHRDMVSGGGVIAQIKHSSRHPADQFASALAEYDREVKKDDSEELRQSLTAYLAGYIRSTKTWSVLPPLTAVPGIHLVAVDWMAPAKTHVIRPALAFSSKPLSPEDVMELALMQLELHLARYPNEKPLGY